MSVGLSSRFNILEQSPHDAASPMIGKKAVTSEARRWVPSHYNIRAITEDGRMVLWNTFRNSMSVFNPEQVEVIQALLSQQGVEAEKEGVIKYLVDRGFLISEDSNEYRQVQVEISRQQFRTDRLELILMTSEDCNFRCKYCYEDFAKGTMLPEVREGVRNLVRSRLSSIDHLGVSYFGGEPLYGFQALEELAPFFCETVDENSLTFHSHMTTNGYLLTPEVADKLLEWRIRDFQITVDGMPEHHDQNRPTRDGRGTFQQIFDNLRALQRRDDEFTVLLRINFDQENSPELEPFLEILEEDFSGDSRFILNFFPIGKWGGPDDDNLNVCGTQEAAEVQGRLQAEARRRGLELGSFEGVNRLGSEVCYAARPYNYLIGAHGQVMKCTIALDMHDYNVVGQLHRDGSMELDDEKMALWTEPAFENDRKCQKCVVVPLCQGTHCPMIRIEENRSPCCGTRHGAKNALRNLVQNPPAHERAVEVKSSAA